jgi:hypothetical protein
LLVRGWFLNRNSLLPLLLFGMHAVAGVEARPCLQPMVCHASRVFTLLLLPPCTMPPATLQVGGFAFIAPSLWPELIASLYVVCPLPSSPPPPTDKTVALA